MLRQKPLSAERKRGRVAPRLDGPRDRHVHQCHQWKHRAVEGGLGGALPPFDSHADHEQGERS